MLYIFTPEQKFKCQDVLLCRGPPGGALETREHGQLSQESKGYCPYYYFGKWELGIKYFRENYMNLLQYDMPYCGAPNKRFSSLPTREHEFCLMGLPLAVLVTQKLNFYFLFFPSVDLRFYKKIGALY